MLANKIITSPHYNRPQCTEQMLDYLSKCYGVQEYIVLIGLEPGCDEVKELINKYKSLLNIELIEHQKLMGCWTNKKLLVDMAFEEYNTNFLIHIEDDVILSKDALKYFEWCDNHYEESIGEIFSVTAFNIIRKESIQQFQCSNCKTAHSTHAIARRKKYTSVAWGTWRNRWEEFAERWNGQDAQLESQFRLGRCEVIPVISRANHIGYTQGTISHDSTLYYVNKCVGVCPDVKGLSREYKFDNDNVLWNKKPENFFLANENREEYIKLDDDNIKSRPSSEYYKKHHHTELWIDDLQYSLGQDFYDCGYSQIL